MQKFQIGRFDHFLVVPALNEKVNGGRSDDDGLSKSSRQVNVLHKLYIGLSTTVKQGGGSRVKRDEEKTGRTDETGSWLRSFRRT